MQQFLETLEISTSGRAMIDISRQIADVLSARQAADGLLTVFIRHTSASLTIQENADPDVQHDLLEALSRLAPEVAPYEHTVEGPDDMPAHIKSMLTGASLSVPVTNGQMMLGTWQGLYLIEHRARAHGRQVVLHFIGSINE